MCTTTTIEKLESMCFKAQILNKNGLPQTLDLTTHIWAG